MGGGGCDPLEQSDQGTYILEQSDLRPYFFRNNCRLPKSIFDQTKVLAARLRVKPISENYFQKMSNGWRWESCLSINQK